MAWRRDHWRGPSTLARTCNFLAPIAFRERRLLAARLVVPPLSREPFLVAGHITCVLTRCRWHLSLHILLGRRVCVCADGAASSPSQTPRTRVRHIPTSQPVYACCAAACSVFYRVELCCDDIYAAL